MADHSDLGFTPATPAPAANAHADLGFTPAAPPSNSPSLWHSLADAGGAFWEGIGGKALMDVLGGASRDPERAKKALETGKALVHGIVNEPARVWNELSETGKAMLHGDAPGAAFHAAGAVPLVGAPAQQVGSDFANGDYAKGFGHALGLLLPFAASALPKDVRVSPALENPNPVEAAAVKYLQQKGIPVDAGTATGSAYVRGLQKLADTSPIGAAVSRNAEAATVNGIRRTAAELVADQTPNVSAERHYADFRSAEARPQSMRAVPTGELDPLGDPVQQSMPMPVPVGTLKEQLKPILDEMSWMPAADRNASAGYQAIKKIVEGPDYIPASTAEIGLGGIKKMAREDVGRNRGLAKLITPKLQELIDGVVSETGGADAVDSLQKARAAAAREAGTDWLTDTFKTAEAEGGFNHTQALWGKWTRLADDAKKTMFSPAQTRDLNNFFLGVKKLAENPNPSGSGVIANIGGQMALLGARPAAGAAVILGTGAISKLLHSPGGVQLLTEGLRVPVGSSRGLMIGNRIMQMVGNAALDGEQQ